MLDGSASDNGGDFYLYSYNAGTAAVGEDIHSTNVVAKDDE
jgi:hypothetical protein